jgi:hypothetical protein
MNLLECNKDIGFTDRFKFEKGCYSNNFILQYLQRINIESVRLVDSNGLILMIREIDYPNNIKIYFQGNKNDCIKYANQITENVIISDSFNNFVISIK